MSDETIGISIVEKSANTNALIKAVRELSSELGKLDPKANNSTNSTKKFGDANDQASGKVKKLKSEVGGIGSAFTGFQGAIAGVIGALSVSKLIGYADTFTNIENKMRLATRSQADLSAGMRNSFTIAQETRTKFEDVAGVYGKVTETLKSMNRPASDAAAITKTIAQAVAISGTSAEAAANGLRQFEQGLGSGTLRGDEFNSVLENTPGLAKAIAEGMGVPVGALRALAEAGTLTSTQLVSALTTAAGKVNGAFQSMAPTIQQAWIVIENATTNYIGQANQASGFTGILARSMIGLANNINIVVPALVAIGAAVALVGFAALISQVAALAVGFTTFMVALGPVVLSMGALAATLAPVIIAFAGMAAGLYALNELFKKFGTSIIDVVQSLASMIGLGERFKALRENVAGTFSEVSKKAGETIDYLKGVGEAAKKAGSGLADAAGTVGKTGKNLAELNAEAQKSGKFLNSFGEDVDELFGGVKKLGKGLADTRDEFAPYQQSAYSAAAGNDNLAGSIGSSNAQLNAQVGAAGSASSALQGYTASANQAAAATSRFSDLASGLGNIRDAARAAADNYSGPVAGGGAPDSYTGDYNAGAAGGSFGGMANPDYSAGGATSLGGFTTYIGERNAFRDDMNLVNANPINMLGAGAAFSASQIKAFQDAVQNVGTLYDELKRATEASGQKFEYGEATVTAEGYHDISKVNALAEKLRQRIKSVSTTNGGSGGTGGSVQPAMSSAPSSGARPVQIVVYAEDANSFRKSEKQLGTDMIRQLEKAFAA